MASCQNYSGCSNCDVISWVSIINSSPRLYNFTYWFSCNNLISLILMSLQIYRIRECLASGSKVCATAVEMWRYVSSVKQREGEIVQNWDSNYSQGCCASFCFWCLNYKTAENLGKSGLLYTLLGCIMPCIPIMLARTEARERYNIEVSRGEERRGREGADELSLFAGRPDGRCGGLAVLWWLCHVSGKWSFCSF